MPTATAILWGHALAALIFGGLVLAQFRQGAGVRPLYVTALALTALWAVAVAGIGPRDLSVALVEPLRDLAWLGAMYAALKRDRAPGIALTVNYLVVGAVCVGTLVAAMLPGDVDVARAVLLLQMITAVAALVLTHNLAAAAPSARGGLRLAMVALAAMWTGDLLVSATAFAASEWPFGVVALRGFVMAAAGAMLAVAGHRNGDWLLRPSRSITVGSLSLAALALYVVATVLATGLFANVGGHYTRLLQTAFVAGATATLIGTVASPWLRAWAKVMIAKHLFDHRYDYRREWLRFTATLGRPPHDFGADTAPIEQRVVKALADLTDSPGGLLLIATADGLEPAAGWNWLGEGALTPALAEYLAATDRILDLDGLRAVPDAEAALVPAWLADRADAWALVPLIHLGRLTGAVVLARPPVPRPLDWEDFDLLRVAGRQVASYLAEGRAASALAEAQRFEEFNRRFAFIVHDVKNLVSQLTLVARNAERHADNPAFRADMIATLQDSCGRMAALLQRLSQHSGTRADPPRPTDVTALAERIARQRRQLHPIAVTGPAAVALVDPVRFEQLLTHLVQNAIEASAPAAPIAITVEAAAERVTITVADRGCGMTAAFIRDELFRPFASSKDGGFGIGAFEVRQLAAAMHGTITVDSRPGEGTRFAVSFPAAPALEQAA